MSPSPQVTDETAFEAGSLGLQVVLFVVTGTLYGLYWLYKTAKQLDAGTDQNLTPILAVIPIVNIIGVWQISNAAEAVTDQSGVVLFLLFVVFGPISWFLIQSGINDAAAN
ncbi:MULTISPECIES: DUF4234 domain-containing protein [unclassified Haloarcula]|uniref:DUF4234 domain-containing protein n=1 Tax=unclassified Haloarcula TaxID=2624677 RepID=UPI001CD9C66C|nr:MULTISPECIES: DUF4234 domain-containing protein [unclassified Haloarcula]